MVFGSAPTRADSKMLRTKHVVTKNDATLEMGQEGGGNAGTLIASLGNKALRF